MSFNVEKAKEIELADKSLFDNYFTNFSPEISEFTFTNLYIWRNFYKFNFLEFKDHLLVFSKTYFNKWKKPKRENKDTLFFLSPIGPNPNQIILSLFEELKNLEFHRVPESLVNDIQKEVGYDPTRIMILEDRDNWDYVYNKQELVSLPGNKYRHKRRWLSKFKSIYDYDFQIISEELIEKSRQLQLEWCILNECQSHEDLMEEQKAIDYIFDNFSNLKITGGIVCVDGKCVGYTLGEMLNNDTIVIHIEKAHREYEGAYQVVNNLFLDNCFQDAVYVNREQDLGIPGLRKAKESYNPVHMVKKYIIY